MATIGRLSVKIDADSTGLAAGLKSAEAGVNSFSLKAGALVDKLRLIGPAAVLAGGALGVAMVRNVANIADALGKLSTRTGVAVEDLSRLQYAASLSDVSVEQLSGGITRLSRSMSDTAAGTGEAGKAFEAMGISVANADGTLRTQKDVLNDIADRFATYEDGAQKSALAQMIFGRSGAQMITMLNGGSKGLKEMADESDRLGNTIDTKTAKAAERFNDNITRLNTAIGGISRQIAGPMVQALADMTDSINESSKAGNGLLILTGPISAGLDGIATVMETIAVLGVNLAYVLKMTGNELGGLAAQAVAVAKLDFSEAETIGELMRQDAKAAREEVDRLSAAILALRKSGDISSIEGMDFSAENAKFLRQQTVPQKPSAPAAGGGGGASGSSGGNTATAIDQALEEDKIREEIAQREAARAVAFIEALDMRKEALRVANLDEYKLAEEKYQAEVEQLAAAKETLALTEEEFSARMLQIRMDRDTSIMDADLAMLAHEQAIADERVRINQNAEKMILDARSNATQAAIGLLSALGGKSKGAAIAAIALGKAVAIADIIRHTAVAQMHAMAQLGPIAGPAAAAKIGLMGKIQAGLVVATGLVQAGSVGGSGSTMSISPANGTSTNGATTTAALSPSINQTITIQGMNSGDLFSGDAVRTLIDRLIDAQRNGARIVLA